MACPASESAGGWTRAWARTQAPAVIAAAASAATRILAGSVSTGWKTTDAATRPAVAPPCANSRDAAIFAARYPAISPDAAVVRMAPRLGPMTVNRTEKTTNPAAIPRPLRAKCIQMSLSRLVPAMAGLEIRRHCRESGTALEQPQDREDRYHHREERCGDARQPDHDVIGTLGFERIQVDGGEIAAREAAQMGVVVDAGQEQ